MLIDGRKIKTMDKPVMVLGVKSAMQNETVNRQAKEASAVSSIVLLSSLMLILVYVLWNNSVRQPESVQAQENIVTVKEILLNSFSINNASYYVKNYTYLESPTSIDSRVTLSYENSVMIYEIVDQERIQNKIDELLTEGNVFYRMDRLTSPVFDNAFARYQAVVRLDENNTEALAGIKKIYNRYLYLADLVIKKGEYHKVPELVNNALEVGNGYFPEGVVLDKYAKYLDDEMLFVELIAEPTSSGDSKIENAFSLDQSVHDVDEEIYELAVRYIEANNFSSAIRILSNYVSWVKHWGVNNELLFRLYVANENYLQAQALLESSSGLSVVDLSERAARVILARGDYQEALVLLEGHAPDITVYPAYHALKAGLYYLTGNYKKSVVLYENLLDINSENSRYWLGLAVCLNKISDRDAVNAFKYAYQYAKSNSLVKQYLRQNLILPTG